MKRREFLIILLLAILFTTLNFWVYDRQNFFSGGSVWTFPLQIISSTFIRLATSNHFCFSVEHGILCPNPVISYLLFAISAISDFLFWFLVLSAGWLVFKKLTKAAYR